MVITISELIGISLDKSFFRELLLVNDWILGVNTFLLDY